MLQCRHVRPTKMSRLKNQMFHAVPSLDSPSIHGVSRCIMILKIVFSKYTQNWPISNSVCINLVPYMLRCPEAGAHSMQSLKRRPVILGWSFPIAPLSLLFCNFIPPKVYFKKQFGLPMLLLVIFFNSSKYS